MEVMKNTKKQSNKRAVISVWAFILFILLILSAIAIETLEHFPYSSTIHAVFHVCTAIHVLSGMLFAVFVIFHIVYNWRTLKSYMVGKRKWKSHIRQKHYFPL